MTGHGEIAQELFYKGYNCAQAVFCAFCDMTGLDIDTAAKLSSSFGGGLGRLREVCGTVSAASMVLGMLKGYQVPGDIAAKNAHYELVREFAKRFREKYGSIVCRELLTGAGVNAEAGGLSEARTAEFYKKRPCPELVRGAAEILDSMLSEDAGS
ncbi:MAG: C_GCAxxG_C_C family protein [Clostridia bacterium]|nr:C_GCAxxG_C_C family protein [Clostridia bacterium]